MSFHHLDPQQVLESLDAVGLRGDGRILQLNSYENRVFQVFLDDGRVVVAKFYRPGRWTEAQIVEEHAFALELAAAEVPVVPPLVLNIEHPGPGLVLHGDPPTLACRSTPEGRHRYTAALRSAGREPELEDPAALRQLGRFIGRLHAVGRRRPFVHRHHLNARADGRRALKLLLDGGFVPDTQAAAWQDACSRALDAVEAAFDRAEPLATLRLHGDCHLGNVLWRQTGDGGAPHVVDLDDALRMVRHSAWLAERWTDPTFPLNFPFFGTAAYWSQQTAQLREQLVEMAD